MRKMVLVAMLAGAAGFLLASASAWATLRYNIWSSYGQSFQLGYVIGYFDAIDLVKKKDQRAMIQNLSGKHFDKWVSDVNAFYAKPENQTRPVPDAIYEIGARARDDMLRRWGLQRQGLLPVPAPSPAP